MALPVVLFAILIGVSLANGGDDDSGDASARMACAHFRNIAGDAAAGVLGDDQLLPKMREVYDSASVSEVASVKDAARSMLASVTAGDDATAGVESMDAACSSIGE